MDTYLKFVLVGFSIALPVGAVTVEMTKQGLKNGFLHGWAVGVGGMTIDFLLVLAMYLGLAQVLSLPYVQLPLWVVGAIFLFGLAYDSIKNADHGITMAGDRPQSSLWKTYRNGVLVAVSPGNLLFWVSVFGTVLADSYSGSKIGFVLAAAGVLTGILIHDLGLLSIVAATRRAMNRAMIKWTSIAAGILLFGFGCYFLYEFVHDIKDYL
ncbi:LysE family transporter [Rossellomorea marisflavi]|uniref:LysE family translocator n=1 Tax=Rossellomorea marisflavi TaxID=189381 RepID=UPI002852F74F|nr:LysE family transporter [Rossellomorea marisflavi]MDR4938842.1 LysE family transporter [Rossellomorea marisflavi]